ncbi:hypothetical protein [Stenotrophomonas maltophilia]|uniref:hypothetical protein n=1 Tax=Stenotrophomonas maltophilia TaxID=40324 RepID=UPI001FA6EEE2|nr:hypothetical protein [Stenotrophomonas maltophilia]
MTQLRYPADLPVTVDDFHACGWKEALQATAPDDFGYSALWSSVPSDQTELPLDIPPYADTRRSRSTEQATQTDEACNLELATLPPELATFLATLKGRTTEVAMRDAIRRLCDWKPLTIDQLATFLGKSRQYLRSKHLIPMVRDGELRFHYPESAKHPHQAYVTPKAGDL